jgi:glyoxylase-like metal-dependent hydrolase (beta-lactamase superfamily II)
MYMNKVCALKVGEMSDPEPRIFYLGDCSKTINLGVFFYLIKTDDGKNVLVDTGVSKSVGLNPDMLQTPEQEPIALLRSHAVEPGSIQHVIATHLHWDHVSPTLLELPNAKVYVDEIELATIMNPPHPWFAQFTYPDVINKAKAEGRIVTVKDGQEILPGIRVIHTGGHSPGSQAVIVDTSAGKVVLTGDVCFTYRNLENDQPGGFNSNLIECFSGLEKIRRAGDIIIPSHDLAVLERYPNGIG